MQQHNNLEQVSGWSISTTRQEEEKNKVSQERLQKLWWAPAAATSPGVHSAPQLTHAGSCEAREMLGLGTQALKPWGLKHQATDNDVLHQSLFSKPITGKMTISSLSVWTQPFFFCQPKPQTQAGDALRSGANVTRKSKLYKKEDLHGINQSAKILTYKNQSPQNAGSSSLAYDTSESWLYVI